MHSRQKWCLTFHSHWTAILKRTCDQTFACNAAAATQMLWFVWMENDVKGTQSPSWRNKEGVLMLKLEEKTSSVLNLWRGSASLGSVWCHLCLCFSCFIMTLSMWSFCFLYVSKAGKTTKPFSPTEADFPTMTNFFWSGHPTSSCGCGCVWLCL